MWHEECANALRKHLLHVPSHDARILEPPQNAPLRQQVHVLQSTQCQLSESNGKIGLLSPQDSGIRSGAMVLSGDESCTPCPVCQCLTHHSCSGLH